MKFTLYYYFWLIGLALNFLKLWATSENNLFTKSLYCFAKRMLKVDLKLPSVGRSWIGTEINIDVVLFQMVSKMIKIGLLFKLFRKKAK